MSFANHRFILVGILTVGWNQAVLGDSPEKVDRPASPESLSAGYDLYGDPLPAGALTRMGTLRFRHASGVHSICFSKNAKTVVSAGWDGIRMWDGSSGKQLRFFGEASARSVSLSLSTDSKLLASGGLDKLVHLWDMASGKEVRRFQGHQWQIDSVVFSPDGKLLASAGGGGTIRVWDAGNGQEVFRLVGHEGQQVPGGAGNCQIRSLAFSPNSKILASAGFQDKSIRLWDVNTGRQLRRLQGHQDGVFAVVFSTDGKSVFSGSNDETIRIWEVASGRELRTMAGDQGAVYCLALSPDGKTLASGVDLTHKAEAKHLNLTICLWDVASGNLLRRLPGPRNQALCVVFSPDGKTLASGGDDNSLHWWDLVGGKELNRFAGHEVRIATVAIAPDGTTLASSAEDATVRIWNMATGEELHTLPGPESANTPWGSNLAFSPDGRKLACSFGDPTIRLWDAKTARETHKYKVPSSLVRSMAFSPDGKAIAFTGDMVGSVKLDTGQVVSYWKDPDSGEDTGACVAFHPEGKLLASGHSRGTIRIWDLALGKQTRQLRGEQSHISALAFSPDGRYLASANMFGSGEVTKENRTIYLWEVASGKQIRALEGHEGAVFGIAFSPDGKLLASGTGNRWEHTGYTVRLWEIATGMERERFLGHGAPVMSVAFSRDGRKLASGSADSTILVWDVTRRFRQNELKPLDISSQELKSLWADMAGEGAGKAHEAIWKLVAGANQAVPFLKEHLRPAEPVDAHRVAQWIADFDDRNFEVRKKANVALAKLGELAESPLKQALANSPPAEARRRIESLLEKLERGIPTPETLQALRAIEVLEHIRTPEAIQALQTLAKGTPNARVTQESKASLERLRKQPYVTP
jgi:WD40 repeat protein